MSPLTEQVVVKIDYPHEMRHTVREALRVEQPYRMGADPQWYVRMPRDRADLLVANLVQIQGVMATLLEG